MSYLGRVLTVDDQDEDLEIVNHILKKSNYETISAKNGVEALDVLEHEKHIDVIVLDRMMPQMDGMTFMRRLKENNRFRDTPVIMQTAADEEHQVMEGIEAGVYWYITKPFQHQMLSCLVRSALRTNRKNKKLFEVTDFYIERRKLLKKGMEKMEKCTFTFRTLEEARNVAHAVACAYPEPRKMTGAISELLVNAVEHGNLEISFDEKTQLIMEGMWEDEIEFRLNHAQYRNRKAVAELRREDKNLYLTIKDEGNGFDWESFMTLDSSRVHKVNGRGIYLASLAFDEIKYQGTGSEVVCNKVF